MKLKLTKLVLVILVLHYFYVLLFIIILYFGHFVPAIHQVITCKRTFLMDCPLTSDLKLFTVICS